MNQHDYFGHKVTAIVLAAIPMEFAIDAESFWHRLILSLCGGLGAVVAIATDRPKNWQETAIRMGSGFVSCFLFGPYLSQRFGQNDMNSHIAMLGVIGIVSWYVMGSVTRWLQKAKDSDFLALLMKVKSGGGGLMALLMRVKTAVDAGDAKTASSVTATTVTSVTATTLPSAPATILPTDPKV
jgi:hypothetical protein